MPITAATFDEVWEAEFAPRIAEQQRRDNEQRTEAFLDVDLAICGEPVRQMTPRDLLYLDALANPFISGSSGTDIHILDCAGFIWQLSPANSHTASLANIWRRARFMRRISLIPIPELARGIVDYCDRMFMDQPAPQTEAGPEESSALRPTAKTHFLAPLLVNVAADMGHIDPMSGELLAHTPMPRLIQYARTIVAQKHAEKVYDETDSLRSQCLARLNQINAERRQAAQDDGSK